MKFKLLLTTLICTQLFISNSYAMTSDELRSLAPYADSGTIDNAIVQYLEQSSNIDLDLIITLAPYASSGGIDAAIQRYSETSSDINLDLIRSLAPYASSAGVDTAIDKYSETSSNISLDAIRVLAPYASSSSIDTAIQKYSETSSSISLDAIKILAPYASSSSIDSAIQKYSEKSSNINLDIIRKLAPYASSTGIDSAIKKYSETASDINLEVITTLAPYASSASIDTAIIKTIEQGNKNVDAIGKILSYAGNYKLITNTLSKAATKKTVLLEKTITKKQEIKLDSIKVPQNSLIGIEITTDSEISFEMKNLKRKNITHISSSINKLQSPYYDLIRVSEDISNRIINIAPSKRNKNQNLNVTIKLISYEL